MLWLLPRSDPGVATESLRPNGWGVREEGRKPTMRRCGSVIH